MARRQLERTTVRSPLSGVVLHVFRKSGELVDGTPATPILEVGDPSALELVGTAVIFGHDVIDIRKGLAGGYLQGLFGLGDFRRGRGGFYE